MLVSITLASLTICPLYPQQSKFASSWFLTHGNLSELILRVTTFWTFKSFLKAHSYSNS